MVATPSTMVPLGTPAAPFALGDCRGEDAVSLDDCTGPALVVMFISNHCPYVKRIMGGLADFGNEMAARGVDVIAICSNDDQAYPDDAPDAMADVADRFGFSFPYLWDCDQDVAKAYRAACTPDFFVYDADHRLVYRGQFDDARPSNEAVVDGRDLRAAVDAVLAGRPASAEQRPSLGCNIKWRPGNEPG